MRVPLVVWSGHPGQHEISTILLTSNQTRIVTGAPSGHLCIWEVNTKTNKIQAQSLVSASSSAICALAEGGKRYNPDDLYRDTHSLVICASEDGTLSIWDPADGLCINSHKDKLVTGKITSLETLPGGQYGVVSGHFSEILLFDVNTLRTVQELPAASPGDWHAAACLYKALDQNGETVDALFTISITGTLSSRVILSGGKIVSGGAATLSADLRIPHAIAMSVNPYTHMSLVVVATNAIHVFDLADKCKLLLSIPCTTPHDRGWAGARFIAPNYLLAWSKVGVASLYEMPSHPHLPNHEVDAPQKLLKDEDNVTRSTTTQVDAPAPYRHMVMPSDPASSASTLTAHGLSPCFCAAMPAGDGQWALVRGDSAGKVAYWNIHTSFRKRASNATPDTDLKASARRAAASKAQNLLISLDDETETDSTPSLLPAPVPAAMAAHPLSFDPFGPIPTASSTSTSSASVALGTSAPNSFGGLSLLHSPLAAANTATTMEEEPRIVATFVTNWPTRQVPGTDFVADLTAFCSLNSDQTFFQLFLGFSNGIIVGISLMEFLLEICKPNRAYSSAKKMIGHEGPITSLLVPQFNTNFIVSGSTDSTVRVWNMDTGELHHAFRNQCGEITKLMCPSSQQQTKLKNAVCAVSTDHSVGIYALEPPSCMYVFGGHTFPIQTVRWRPADDILVVGCSDGSAYVWQLGTAHLDSMASGQVARDIINNSQRMSSRAEAGGPLTPEQAMVTPRAVKLGSNETKVMVVLVDVDLLATQIVNVGMKHRNSVHAASNSSAPSTPTSPMTSRPASPQLSKRETIVAASDVGYVNLLSDFILSMLMRWGKDARIDTICTRDLGLEPPRSFVSYGICGHNDRLSLLLPNLERDLQWKVSPMSCTSHLLAVTALTHARSRTAVEGSKEAPWLQVITYYTVQVTESALSDTCPKDLRFLTRFLETPQYDLKKAARTHLVNQLQEMNPADLKALASELCRNLGDRTTNFSEGDVISTVLVGILVSQDNSPAESEMRNVCEILNRIVLDEKAPVDHRCMCLEVLGSGFSKFHQCLDPEAFVYTLLELSSGSGETGQRLASSAATALGHIGSNNPQKFVATITRALQDARRIAPTSILKVIRRLVKKRPIVLVSQLIGIVDMVLKCLDPNMPKKREMCLEAATALLHDMVEVYPMIHTTRHQSAQRLSVGGNDGVLTIFDLKTATKWQSFQAHNHPISAMSVSTDGKHLASFSSAEVTLKIWHIGSSMFGIMSSAIKCVKTFNITNSYFSRMTIQEQLDKLKLVWIDKHNVKVTAGDNGAAYTI